MCHASIHSLGVPIIHVQCTTLSIEICEKFVANFIRNTSSFIDVLIASCLASVNLNIVWISSWWFPAFVWFYCKPSPFFLSDFLDSGRPFHSKRNSSMETFTPGQQVYWKIFTKIFKTYRSLCKISLLSLKLVSKFIRMSIIWNLSCIKQFCLFYQFAKVIPP